MQDLHEYKLLALAQVRQRELERARALESLREQAKSDQQNKSESLRESVTKAVLVLAFGTLE